MFHTPRYISIIDYFLSRNVHTFYSRLIVGERYKLFLISIFFFSKGQGRKRSKVYDAECDDKMLCLQFPRFPRACIYIRVYMYIRTHKSILKTKKIVRL